MVQMFYLNKKMLAILALAKNINKNVLDYLLHVTEQLA